MAYGVLYEFRRTSTNGADILITISQRDYEGEVKQRSLGRAPVLKRENNGHIYGTSCELYAECLVDGEFSQLYTSDAYEFRVAVYRNDSLLWMGFVSPELYSEPDVAPPYDVQIIATDGLGELKNFKFEKRGVASMLSHINYLMGKTGIGMALNIVSELRYVDDAGVASADKGVLDFKINLDHEEGSTCYDVLQNLLSSINANITQYNGRYLIFRETDFINKATEEGVEGFDINGSAVSLPVASFGSMNQHKWWPVGQLSTVIEPAKNEVVLRAPDHYKDNVLDFDDWALANAASFNEEEGAYILPDEGSNISQYVDFDGVEVGYRLGLRVRARNVGSSEDEQNIGIKVEIEGRSYSAGDRYWLVKSSGTSSGRQLTDYMWRNVDDYIEEELPLPSDADTDSDAQDIDIVLPLYRNGSRSYVYAKNVKLTIFNPAGIHDIYVYGVSLVKYEQIEGYEADVVINNAAREEEGEVELTMSAGDLAPAAGKVFMTGIPLLPSGSDPIKQWQVGDGNHQDYLSVMAYDYSRAIALPKMKYAGVLNVPGTTVSVPLLFLRDGTYYFPKTYSYDIYNDELEVELISISSADVSLTSVIISQMVQSSGNMGGLTTSGSGGGGVVSLPRDKEMSDTSDNAVENKVIKAYVDGEVKEVADLLTSMWYFDSDGNLCTDHDVIIKANLIVEKDTSSGGEGEDTPASGGIRGIYVNNVPYTDEDGDGFIDLGTISGGVSEITASMITSALGYTPANGANYLPLAGGILNGSLQVGQSDNTGYKDISVVRNGVTTYMATTGAGEGYFGAEFANGNFAALILTDGVPRYGYNDSYYTLIHSGNIGSQSVLSAQKVITADGFNALEGDTSTLRVGYGYRNLTTNIYGNEIYFAKNGAITMSINSSGNVTIGASDLAGTTYKMSVDGKVHIRSTADAAMTEGAGSLIVGNRAVLMIDANDIQAKTNGTTAGPLYLNDWGGNVILCGQGKGNVGIGTPSPKYQLDVDGTGRFTGAVTMSSTLTVGGNITPSSHVAYDLGAYNNAFNKTHSNIISSGTNDNNLWLVGGAYDSSIGIQFARNPNGSASGKIGSWDATGLYPATNNAYTLGTSSLKWSHVNAYKYHVGGNYYTYITESGGYLDLVSFGNEMCIGTSSNSGDIHINYRKSSSGYVPSTYYWRAGSSSSYADFYLGSLVAAGDTSSGSDIRFKDIIKDKTLKIEDIAKAPLFTFKWNDRDDDTIHLGSSAQYWEKVCPWLVSGSDFKSLNYGVGAMGGVISLARHDLQQDKEIKAQGKEIKALKRTVKVLKKEIKRLKEEMRYGDR